MFSATVSFDVTFGEPRRRSRCRSRSTSASSSTRARRPAQLDRPAARARDSRRSRCAQLTPAPGELLAHPLGIALGHQRVAPLGVDLARFGTAPVEGETPLRRDRVHRRRARRRQPSALQEDFAPAQFRELSDDEKLVRAVVRALRGRPARARRRAWRFDTSVAHPEPRSSTRRRSSTRPDAPARPRRTAGRCRGRCAAQPPIRRRAPRAATGPRALRTPGSGRFA